MLQTRIRHLKQGRDRKGPVLYWMSRDQRVDDNWALICAQDMALRDKVPLAVVFCLVPEYLGATGRQYAFMFAGLKELSGRIQKLDIPFFLLMGEPGDVLPRFMADHDVASCVTDFDPLRIKRRWKQEVLTRADATFLEVDAHNIVPCVAASPKLEYGAYTIRKKIQKALPFFLDDFPELQSHPFRWPHKVPHIDWVKLADSVKADKTIGEAGWIVPGEGRARQALQRFIDNGLVNYDEKRNNPVLDGQSGLSPYLHFGQLSAQRVVLEVEKSYAPGSAKAPFLEELIVRRELSDNFCWYNPDYDSVDGFPQWARKTLDEHRRDERPYLYSTEQFEQAITHDDLWNAAQSEMIKKGKMHGYIRMYWAKKILEWTGSPEEAMKIAIYLNDKYELDGRDPNGYTGIAWSIGGVHDRAWSSRVVLGKIRYMSYNGCRAKFDVKAYIEQVRVL